MRRVVNPYSDTDVDGDIYVPVTQTSGIPFPVETQTYEGSSRIPAQPESFRTSQRNMGYGYGRQEAPRRYQLYNIPAPTFKSTNLRPRDCQCPVHCPKKRPIRGRNYRDPLGPSSSGIWQVQDLSDSRRSGTAARPAPRGTLKTADERRGPRRQ